MNYCDLVPLLLAAPIALGSEVEMTPFQSGGKISEEKRFISLEGETTGLDFVPRLLPDHPYAYLYHSGMTCSGIATGDVDGDGRPDLFLANGPGKNALYLQTGEAFNFEDVTASAGKGLDGGDAWAAGVALADLDDDGDLDLYVCNYEAPNQLFLNLGASEGKRVVFKECAKEAGVDVIDASHFPAFADYDNDGDLDFYLLTNRVEDPRGGPAELPVEFERPGVPQLKSGEDRYYNLWIVDANNWGTEPYGRSDYLFRNEGANASGIPKFSDVSDSAGIAGRGDGLSCLWWDSDLDGDLDLYVGNDFISPDKFYINNGDGTFTNHIAEAMPHTTWFSMGSDFGDLDNDGDFDLMVADMSATSHYKSKVTMGVMGGMTLFRANNSNPPQYMRNALFLNEGENMFREGAFLAKMASSDWTWAIKMDDFDGDGQLDVYLTNGVPREMNHSDIVIEKEDLVGRHMWEYFKDGKMRKEQNTAFRGEGNLGFSDVSKDWGLAHMGASYGAVTADFDRDGDLDLAVMNLEENVSIYRNDTSTGNQLTVSLRGTKSNKRGLGAVVEAYGEGRKWIRQMNPGTGYHSYDEDLLHFGLGEVGKLDKLVVRWPSGIVQEVAKPKINHRLVVIEAGAPSPSKQVEGAPMFVASTKLEDVWHRENDFDDFALQSLLPHRLSMEGPAVAWGDVNGDGMLDLFLGGAAGVPAEIRLAEPDRYRLTLQPALFKDLAGEDVDAEFLDIDGDNDLDLFVARGSYEFDEGAEEQANRLYLNDGTGKFSASGSLPKEALNSGTLAFADFDKDGDLDVFLGTRVKHGEYPLSQPSRIWINEEGQFTDQTSSVAPALEEAGLVTAACWADVDGDSFLDLVVAREWGAVAVYLNEEGTNLSLMKETGEMGQLTGWWGSLAAGDLDGDGDLDLVAGNVGLNTKYKTSAKKPMTLYYGDFDDTGKRHIVEVKQEGEICYPERGRSCSSGAMPFIAKKFETFHDFGIATLDEIYGDDKLKAAERFEANTFKHLVFLNDGSGRFAAQALPKITQIAPVGAIVLGDIDGDQDLDIVLGQNFHGPQVETGHYDGGLSQVLLNQGSAGFEPVEPARAGVKVRGGVTSLEFLDLDQDGRGDLVFACNNGPIQVFYSR